MTRGKILLVDDEKLVLRSLQLMLEHLGYSVVACLSSDKALSRFAADHESFDKILTDISLHGISGITLSERIRDTDPDIPIIWMTGDAAAIAPKLLDTLQISQLIEKPITLELFDRALQL